MSIKKKQAEIISHQTLFDIAREVRKLQTRLGFSEGRMARELNMTLADYQRLIHASIVPPEWLAVRKLAIIAGESADTILQVSREVIQDG